MIIGTVVAMGCGAITDVAITIKGECVGEYYSAGDGTGTGAGIYTGGFWIKTGVGVGSGWGWGWFSGGGSKIKTGDVPDGVDVGVGAGDDIISVIAGSILLWGT